MSDAIQETADLDIQAAVLVLDIAGIPLGSSSEGQDIRLPRYRFFPHGFRWVWGERDEDWKPSTDVQAAFELVAVLHAKGWRLNLQAFSGGLSCMATFAMFRNKRWRGGDVNAVADIVDGDVAGAAALAITRAALLTRESSQ